MALVIANLSKTYANGSQALRGVTLTIPTGMFGLLGPNGAGKSSLMRTIATLQDADAGSIHLDDLDVLRDKEAVRRVLGYLPQAFGVYPKVSAEGLLDHLATLKGIANGRERKEMVAALLHQTNLYEVRKKYVSGYSGGIYFGLLLVLPNLFFTGAIFFTLATLTRNILASYIGAILLLVGYLISVSYVENLKNEYLIAVADVFGLNAQALTTRYWTSAEKNTLFRQPVLRPVGCYPRHAAVYGSPALAAVVEPGQARILGHHTQPLLRGHRWGRRYFLAEHGRPGRQSIWHAPYPVTAVVLSLAGGSFNLFLLLIITLYSGELVWREREAPVN